MSSIELVAKLKAVDEASDKIAEIGEKTKKAMDDTEKSVKKADFSFKQFTTSISGVMTAGFNLYNLYDRIDDAQRNVEKAQYALNEAEDQARQKQEAYNKAIEKFGANSPEAVQALDDLRDAQEKVRLKSEELKDKQDRVSESMVQMAIQIVPTAITAITNLKGTVAGLTGAFDAAKVSVVGFAGAAGLGALSLGLAGVGAAVGVLYIGWTEDWDGIRTKTENTINEIKKYLDDLGNYLNSFIPNLDGFTNSFTSAFDGIGSCFSDLVNDINSKLDDIIEAFQNAYDEIVGGSIWPNMWKDIKKVTKKGIEANINLIGKGIGGIERGFERGPSVTNIHMTVNTGPISSSMDQERMYKEISRRLRNEIKNQHYMVRS